MIQKILFISNSFQKPDNWENENSISRAVFTDKLSFDDIITSIKEQGDSIAFVIYIHSIALNGQYADNNGFDIAREIRIKLKNKAPIILFSPIQKEFFEQKSKSDVKYNLLFARGTTFLAFDKLKTNLKSTIKELLKHPITDACLADMNNTLLSQMGVVADMLSHELYYTKINGDTNKLNKLLDDTALYLEYPQLEKLNWYQFQDELINNILNEEKFKALAQALINRCKSVLLSQSTLSQIGEKKEHTILILEDDPVFRQKIYDNLQHQFEKIIATGSALEAIRILNEDVNNSITGIIADWRLYVYNGSEKTNYWQIQGYEVLEYAAHNHFIALFALTSLDEGSVHNIRNELGLDIFLFKKQHLESNDGETKWQMMADTIKHKCRNMVSLISSDKAMGANWFRAEEAENKKVTKFLSLRDQYMRERVSGWKIFEENISKRADEIWEYYQPALGPQGERDLKDIKDWVGQLESAGTPLLENILVVRRIWLALWFNITRLDIAIYRKFMPSEMIYCLLKRQNIQDLEDEYRQEDRKIKSKNTSNTSNKSDLSIEEKVEKNLKTNATNLQSVLCLKKDLLPKGILPEEENWLLRHSIKISKGNDVHAKNAKNENDDADDPDFDPSTKEGQAKIKQLTSKFDESFEVDNIEDQI